MGKLNIGGRCPKCGGNLFLDRDYNGWYEQCLQCAHMKDLAVVYQKKGKTAQGLKEFIHVESRSSTGNKDVAPEKY